MGSKGFHGSKGIVLLRLQGSTQAERMELRQNDAFGTVEPLEPLEPWFYRYFKSAAIAS